MNIGFDAKRAYHNHSGLGNYSRFVLDAISEFQPELESFAFNPKHAGHFQHYFSGKRITEINPPPTMPTAWWRRRGLNAQVDALKLDWFHGLSAELPSGLNVPSSVTIHDLIFLRFPELYGRIDRAIYTWKTKRACEIADKIVAVSTQTAQDLVDFLKVDTSKIEVIGQGVHPQFLIPPASDSIHQVRRDYLLPEDFVLTVGTQEVRKNQILLIRAAAKSGKSLVILGRETSHSMALKQEAARLKAPVTFLSGVPFQAFPAIYAASSGVAYVSRFEGFGIPVLEGLYQGKSVLAATGSCLEETGGRFAAYISPDDVNSAADWMKQVPSLRDGVEEWLMQFSAEEVSNKLSQLWRNS